ncbi:putative ribonuclease H protein [Trifolium medium]|uniref:Putative ribonuclease H protein n=1 Tax=Trifolium medium TaxID=97028 RepID=A0A392R0N8_9FABA|nr:putative ribonuclease H protein [Trifolium medium]
MMGRLMNKVYDTTAFNVENHLSKAQVITEIIWQPPPLHWVKCNSEGASKGNPDPSACGG